MLPAAGIAAWLAMGPPLQFDDDWQLDINTAVAVELMIMTTFLQSTKRRHRLYMHVCAQKLGDLDAELEEQLLGEATVDEVTPNGTFCESQVLVNTCHYASGHVHNQQTS